MAFSPIPPNRELNVVPCRLITEYIGILADQTTGMQYVSFLCDPVELGRSTKLHSSIHNQGGGHLQAKRVSVAERHISLRYCRLWQIAITLTARASEELLNTTHHH